MVECRTVNSDVPGSKPGEPAKSPSSSGLGRRPFTALTRVQIPLGTHELTKAGEIINNEAIDWWIEYCKINNFKLLYSQ